MDRIALPSRTVIACAAAAIAVALGVATAATAAGTAAPFTYVALGDSYSSGEGISPFLGSGCHRSSRAYPTWVRRPGAAKTLYATASGGGRPGVLAGKNKYGSDSNVRTAGGVSWASWACSGAKTANVLPRSLGGVPQQRLGETLDRATQLDSADLARADLVTLTIGGNDAGFIEVLLVCALSNCNTRTFEQGRAAIIDATRPQLEKVYRAVARKAPRARILVLGYPGLFPATKAEQACAGLSRFRGEQTMLRRLGERLNGTIAAAVADGGPVRRADRVRAGLGPIRRPRGLRPQGAVAERVRDERHRPGARCGVVPPEPRGTARRLRGSRQRGSRARSLSRARVRPARAGPRAGSPRLPRARGCGPRAGDASGTALRGRCPHP